jgi:hypothetical protein
VNVTGSDIPSRHTKQAGRSWGSSWKDLPLVAPACGLHEEFVFERVIVRDSLVPPRTGTRLAPERERVNRVFTSRSPSGWVIGRSG